MKRSLLFLSLLTLAAHGAAAPKVELPAWTDPDRKEVAAGKLVPGLDLLGTDPAQKNPSNSIDAVAPQPGELAANSLHEVPERYLNDYFSAHPDSFLVDPQGLLDTKLGKERQNFLNYHAGDSKIDLYLYLFPGDQEIPGSVRAEELPERAYASGKPALIVFYFLGAPERTQMWVSPGLESTISSAEQGKALTASISKALQKQDPVAQLEVFCVQMSIQSFWLERMAGLASDSANPSDAHPKKDDQKKPPSGHEEMKQQLLGYLNQWGVTAGAGAVAVAIAGLSILVLRSRRRFRLPDLEVPARLGGAHGAGVGAVISFGSSAQSPVTQRQELPGYLGGL